MRELKFRLIRDGKIVGYEKHTDGIICHSQPPPHNLWHSISYIACECTGYMTNDPALHYWITHDSKDQFTGLEDKNDMDLYDNDIIDYDGIIATITWRYGGWIARYWVTDSKVQGFDSNGNTTFPEKISEELMVTDIVCSKLIGNIHDNPELMED